ncbi:MAG: hypothetical protein ACP5UQ_07435 [Anaerolineae bacterium]
MKRPFSVVVFLLILSSLTAAVQAAPSAQGPKPVITQPEPDAAVRGVVQIIGSATHPQFQRYELYYAPYPVPSDNAWIFIGDAHFQQQPAGLLGTWATGGLPDGAYVLRVRVVRQDGNYTDSDPRRVFVANKRPIETPTPAVTPQPTAVPTPLPPTPTVVIAVPTVQLPRAAITPTVEAKASPTPLLSEARPTPAADVAQIVDTARLAKAARTAATYTVGLFVAIGAFFAVKAALAWLWHKVRP